MTTITLYHGAAQEHKTLKAQVCERGFKGVWLTDNKDIARGYATRRGGRDGYIATVEIDADTIMGDIYCVRDEMMVARTARQEGYAGVENVFGYFVMQIRKAGLRITGWEAA